MRCWQNLSEQPEVELPVWNTTYDLWPLHSSAKVSICRSQSVAKQQKPNTNICVCCLYVYHANIVTVSLNLDHTYFLIQASCNIHSLKHNTNLSIIAMKAIWFPMWTPGGLFPMCFPFMQRWGRCAGVFPVRPAVGGAGDHRHQHALWPPVPWGGWRWRSCRSAAYLASKHSFLCRVKDPTTGTFSKKNPFCKSVAWYQRISV